MRHHQAAAGPAIRAWLAEAFEPVRRSIDDIKHDYETLIDAVKDATGGQMIVLNRMSTSGYEDLSNYMGFDLPLSDTLANVASKELNLMLEDIADTRELHVVDVDAIAANIGGREHLPDGIHQSGPMQMVLRQEILEILTQIRLSKNPSSS
jgi:small ligand-binding sensory domain FIST